MLFHSLPFLVFILLFFAGWQFTQKNKNFRFFYITFFSFFFYGWWDWRFLFLLIFTGLVDFAAAIYIEKYTQYKKWLLAISLGMNLGVLGFFKYFGFFSHTIDSLFSYLGFATHLHQSVQDFGLILPVGISFYTFQSMSYTIDVYRGRLKASPNILHFFAFLSLFPQLVAGPIIRARDLLYQIEVFKKPSYVEIWHGLRLIVYGYFLKMVLADNIAAFVNDAFSFENKTTSTPFWWAATLGFGLQIYFDFNGYSSIARGLAKLMGYHFKLNFNHPYQSFSLKEFWQRWHISLSTWFRDYVYIPLGGSQKGKLRSHLNMWITMLLSGLWHGANFTFLIWGGLHALYVSIERETKYPQLLAKNNFTKFLLWTLVMLQVLVAWVFFRAESVEKALIIMGFLFSFSSFEMPNMHLNGLFWLIIGIGVEVGYFLSTKYRFIRHLSQNNWVEILTFVMLAICIIYFKGSEQSFIYFQF